MNTHVFIVNEKTFKLHLEYMFAGTGAKNKTSTFLTNSNIDYNATSERNLVGMIADVSRIQVGDNIIFYLQAENNRQGHFFGVFKAKTKAFFDENDSNNFLKEDLGKGLSYRILIEPSEYGVFSQGITEHEYLDSLKCKNFPYELCWSLIYRKLKGNRGCTMITNFEFLDLLSKLQAKSNRLDGGKNYTYDKIENIITINNINHIYIGGQAPISIAKRLLYKAKRGNAFETHLQAYILQNIKSLKLLDLPKSEFWIGNEVSCGVGMQRIDILIIQKYRNKVFIKVIELKDEIPTTRIVDVQLKWYIEWLLDYIIPNYKKYNVYVTPCIIASKTHDENLKNYFKNKNYNNLYPYVTINSTEYYSFNIGEKEIIFEKEL